MVYYFEQDLSAAKHERQTEAAHAALLLALRREYGLTELPKLAADERGKPYFPERPDLCFNYSHCRAGILVGIGKTAIGVDAETVRNFKDSLAARVCHPRELEAVLGQPDRNLALTKLWTAKEAYLKYTGEGIRRDLRELDMADILARDPGAFRAEGEPRAENALRAVGGSCAENALRAAGESCAEGALRAEGRPRTEGRLSLGGVHLRLWVRENVCLCACSQEPETLSLRQMAHGKT